MHVALRIAGAIIGGGGTLIAATVADAGLSTPIVLGIAGVMAVLGAVFGPEIWDALLHLF